MNFASISFLFYFLPLTVIAYYLLRGRASKNLLLLAVSLLFYAWGEGLGVSLLISSIIANHFISHQIVKRKQPWLCIGIITNIFILIIFKYLGFLTISAGMSPIEIALPLGISFFTFQAISMLIDVSRGASPSPSVLKTGLYISMFPQLIAGPIVRWVEITKQIDDRTETWDRFRSGTRLFILGLSQKVLIADILAGPADSAFSVDPSTLSSSAAWIGILAFSLQIFYDFAGYSNMAIGIGRMFGFELPRNFSHPYSSASIQEFWRRWHMTLSRWFKDYLYIPLGGSKLTTIKTYRNLLIVFILCGIWHGASWTFMFWGLWHGAFLIMERLGRKFSFPKTPRVFGVLYTFFFVTMGWVLFRAESLPQALGYWKALFSGSGETNIELSRVHLLAFIVGIAIAWDGWMKLTKSSKVPSFIETSLSWLAVIVLLALCFAAVSAATHQPFLYFRF